MSSKRVTKRERSEKVTNLMNKEAEVVVAVRMHDVLAVDRGVSRSASSWIAVVWFRKGSLRIHDNPALLAALVRTSIPS